MPKINYVTFWMTMFLCSLVLCFLSAATAVGVVLGSEPLGGKIMVTAWSGFGALWTFIEACKWRSSEKILIDEIGHSPFKFPRKERWKWYKLEEPRVTKVLQRYATTLDKAITEEESFFSSAGAELSGQERTALLLQLSGNVREAKKEFWRIHKAFELFGCKVTDSYKDYVVRQADYRSGAAEGL